MSPRHRSRFLSRLASLATGATVLALAASCAADRSTAPAPLAAGTFSLRLSGAAFREVSGHARFSTDLANSGIGTAFTMRDGLTNAATRHALYLYRWSTAPLVPGTYRIVPNDEDASPEAFVGGIGLDTGDSRRARACVALEGTLEVTSASAGRIAGTVRFTGACLSLEGADAVPVVVDGRFEAKETILGGQ
jgi:hypothetical protein